MFSEGKIFKINNFRVANNNVIIFDSQQKQLNKSKEFINGLLDKEIKKGTLKTEEKSKIQSNFSLTEDINSFKNADFIVEVNYFAFFYSNCHVGS